jgi:hypothetical protein
MIKNKTNIAFTIFVIIAILEFIFLKDIYEELPESREMIWRGIYSLGFVTICIIFFITIIMALGYTIARIKTWLWHRKYQKAQKRILDDPVHWPGHHKATGSNQLENGR